MRIKYFIDMDGVIAKWNEHATQEEVAQKGYFRAREAEDSAIAFLKLLCEREESVYILSSVYEDGHSSDDKIAWLTDYGLENIPRIFVPYGLDKNDYVSMDKNEVNVLIDDFKVNLESWKAAGGLAIKFHNGINNRSKLEVVGGNVTIKPDSWAGYTIHKDMTPEEMYISVTGVAKLTAGWQFAA